MLAPELLKGMNIIQNTFIGFKEDVKTTKETDIYSLGLILFIFNILK